MKSKNQAAEPLSALNARWTMADPVPDDICRQFPEYPKPIVQLLYNRGLADDDAVGRFLNPTYTRDLHNPRLLKDMDRATGVIQESLKSNRRIIVHGDYDADGVTACACLYLTLRRLGADVGTFIPDRYRDGYGVSAATLRKLKSDGAGLVVTVDCGISSVDAIAESRAAGLKVVVTDHHLPPPRLPSAEAILNPNQPGDNYPNKGLTGVGVAFKLSQQLLAQSGLGDREREVFEKWLLDLVAIGTVADVSALTGENRALVKYGLIVLNKTKRPGLRQLLKAAGIAPGTADAERIGFAIAPRLNAAGRLTHAKAALELLVTDDERHARRAALELHALNVQRQAVTMEAYEYAKQRLGDVTIEDRILVVEGKFLEGIVGLVAGRLTQEYMRPTLVIDSDGETSRGSARSTPALNIAEALAKHRQFLTKHGGHPAAAGFSLPTERLAEFREAFQRFGREVIGVQDLQKETTIECVLDPQHLAFEFVEQVNMFAPFGLGNPRPLFLLQDVEIESVRTVGKDERHLKTQLRTGDGQRLTAMAFGLAGRAELRPSGRLDVAGYPVANTFNHQQSIEWQLTDCRVPETAA